jgi:hypothetical protein
VKKKAISSSRLRKTAIALSLQPEKSDRLFPIKKNSDRTFPIKKKRDR